ncbi:MAG: cyclic nucleotide-binding domain-containing protein [Rhodocyclaceae bacterium]|nr:cyclic nucleotide-binding domain-containing protein [Rhodocyclaceae bacterium]
MTDATLLETLSRLQPFASLGAASLRGLLPLCRRECVTRNLDPFSLKDWHGQLVYLVKGELKVDLADGSTMLFVGGSGEALMPLSNGGAAPMSTKAITDVELLRFHEDSLDIVVTWDQLAAPAAAGDGEEATDWRSKPGIFAAQNFVDGVFAALPPAHIDTLLGRFRRVSVRRGDVVVRQNDPGDYYYVIDRGRAQVTRQVAGATVELAQLKGGDVFGEEALLADTVRNATVTMKTDGALLRLDKDDFVALLEEPLLRKLSPAQALQRVAAGAVWIDARFSAEYRLDGLPGALNIPLNEMRRALAMLEPAQEYVVYCQSGRRSSAAAFLLSQKGYRASLLDGGLKALFAAKGKA